MVMHQKTPPCSKGIETYKLRRCRFRIRRKTPPCSKGTKMRLKLTALLAVFYKYVFPKYIFYLSILIAQFKINNPI